MPTTRVVWTNKATMSPGNSMWGTTTPVPSAATKQLWLASLGFMPELPMVTSVASGVGDHNPPCHTNGVIPGSNL